MKIVFCLPGRSYSGNFLQSWSNLIATCIARGYQINLQQNYSCNIYYVRNMCLGGNVILGPNQKPYNGKLDYDYMLWIDSDIIFTVEDFDKLLSHQADIVSGLYLMEDGRQFATVENWDENFFALNGYFEFLTPNNLQNKTKPFPVNYTGFGFMMIKRGVIESMEYPWFRPEFIQIGESRDFTMEDVAFCREANRKGYKILIDPTVIVGHEKTRILI